MNLSKSQYIRGLQCHKSLWLYKNKPELRTQPDQARQSLLNTGISIGELAKELFPSGVTIEFDADNFNAMIEKTKEYINSGEEVIYEATFNSNGIFAMADILVKNGDFYDVYEVKGSTGVKEYHLNDAAIQWYALNKEINLNKCYIVHVNNQYVRQGDLDLNSLFTITDISDKIIERQAEIAQNLKNFESMLRGAMPKIKIGAQCNGPYGCDFTSVCWKDVPYPSIFNLYRKGKNHLLELYHKGVKRYEDIPSDYRLTRTQQIQVESFKSNEPHINIDTIKNFVDKVEFPINFFDFETFQSGVPRFNDQRPYMQIPFQYSLHILHEDGTIEHKEFLGDENFDPRKDLIGQMLKDITPKGSIMAYNKSFEISRTRELAEYMPEKREELLSLTERYVDLIVPFRKLGYYHPDFNGSFSIKSVLPAMFPNDPELDYKKLGSVQNGVDAMEIYPNLHLIEDKSEREKIRKDLLAYCRLDTLAMVRIWEKLNLILTENKITV